MGVKEFFFGGDATKGMKTQPQTADWQRTYLKTAAEQGAPTLSTGQIDQSRGQQNQLASMLFNQARGLTPGAGELAVQRQANNALANQASMAQMSRGAGVGMAARTAARNAADIGTNAAGQASIAQMQDQQAAQGQLGSLLNATRSQDIQVAGANQSSQLAQQQQNLGALSQLLGVDQAALQQDAARRQIAAGDKGMLPSLLQVGGQIGAAYATGGLSAGAGGGATGSGPNYAGMSMLPSGSYYTQPKPAAPAGSADSYILGPRAY